MSMQVVILLAEAGAASFLRPVLRQWRDNPPGFTWGLAGTSQAHAVLSAEVESARWLATDLDRRHPGPVLAILDRARPGVLLASAGGWAMERAAIRHGLEAGIATRQFVDTWYGYARRLLEGEDAVLPDRIWLVDEHARREAMAAGLPDFLLDEVGHPAWAEVEPLPATNGRSTIFLGAPVARDYGTGLGYTEADAWAMVKAVAAARPDLISGLVYAPHPDQGDISFLAAGGIATEPYETRKLADFGQVLGMFSAPLIEAFLAGRRAISVQPHPTGLDMAPLSRFGYAPRATTPESLIAALEARLPDASKLRTNLRRLNGRITPLLREALRR